MPGLVAGVDVGGTFTDLVILNPANGAVSIAKVATTLPNQAGGVLAAFDAAGVLLRDVDLIVHGTTTTTNAVLERNLCKTGLITTAGFRDVLELGRRTRPNAYGMTGKFVPLIPRDLRLEVAERIAYKNGDFFILRLLSGRLLPVDIWQDDGKICLLGLHLLKSLSPAPTKAETGQWWV